MTNPHPPGHMKKLHGILLTLLVPCSILAQPDPGEIPEGMAFIPGGTFLMGSDDHQPIAKPRHPVIINSFFMDIREVTNAEYYAFCMAAGHRLPEFWGMEIYRSGQDFPDHPVVGISHTEASLYADWVGKRLPTEAEWEYAARGGLEGLDFPQSETLDHQLARYNDPQAPPGPVRTGSYPPNGYGLNDMAGNVWEWVSDWFSETYYEESPEKNPPGPSHGSFRVIRGGGWHSGGGCNRVHHRNGLPLHWVDMAGGFRCVKDLQETKPDPR